MILFFTKGDRTTGSSRQRVWNVAERLKQQYGTDYEVVHSIGYSLFSVNPKRFFALMSALRKLFDKKYTVFFVHKSLFPLDVVLCIIVLSKWRGVPLIYDLDDAEWLHSALKTKLLAKNAKVVLCGSKNIQENIEKYTDKTLLVPTVIDSDVYKRYTVTHKKKDTITIGWIGYGPGYIRNGHFDVFKEALKKLLEKNVTFVFIGAKGKNSVYEYFSDFSENMCIIDELEWNKVGAAPEALQKYGVDIGVAPMKEDAFSKAKCAFKIIEYMAVGLPVVVSPVGEQGTVVDSGVNGFHARTVDEWVTAIKKLADEKTRATMGASGAKKVEKNYSYKHVIPIIAKAVHDEK